MRKPTILCSLLLVLFLCANRTAAQQTGQAESAKASEQAIHFYHLDFLVQELGTDGKPTNSRTYTLITNTDRGNRGVSIRTGSRVPIATGPNSFQYTELGINFDIHNAREVNGKLSLELTADVSSLASPAGVSQPSTPIIRNN